jgi:signal transduction histidine kinase
MMRLWPQSLAARFALVLVAALLIANTVALILLTQERDRQDRRAAEDRELTRLVALVPALDAVDGRARAAIARDASTRFAEVSVDRDPLLAVSGTDPLSVDLVRRLADSLPGRDIRAEVRQAQRNHEGGPRDRQGSLVLSLALLSGDWVNITALRAQIAPETAAARAFALILGLSLLSVLAVGILLARGLTRPLTALAAAARAAGAGDRTARVAITGARELRDASAAFNDMQAQIARFDAERLRVLGAVGHDLRTPITSLRIRAEMLDDDATRDAMVRTLDDMAVMADGLVTYARGGAEAEPADNIALAEFLEQLAQDRGAAWRGGDKATVTGRRVALSRAIGNLIDNALRHGGSAEVALAVTGDRAVVTVADRGPGLPDAAIEAMFAPFARGDASRNADTGGAGLGLSIARTIILAHGGTVTLHNREGGGLEARVELPRSA